MTQTTEPRRAHVRASVLCGPYSKRRSGSQEHFQLDLIPPSVFPRIPVGSDAGTRERWEASVADTWRPLDDGERKFGKEWVTSS